MEVITYWDPKYPGNLRLMPDPPLILYVDGQSFPGREHVAILGTGHPSKAGLDLAYEYGARIARRGRTVVSGLTRGIDAHALEGALAAGGGPIAILGTSLSEIDSHDKRVLAAEVAGSGGGGQRADRGGIPASWAVPAAQPYDRGHGREPNRHRVAGGGGAVPAW